MPKKSEIRISDDRSPRYLSIDIPEIVRGVLRRFYIPAFLALIGGVAGLAFYTYLYVPRYQADTSLYVVILNKDDEGIDVSALEGGSYLIRDFRELFEGRTIAEEVIQDLNLQSEEQAGTTMQYEELLRMVSVSIPDNTRMIRIEVTSLDPILAAEIANEYQKVGKTHISDVTRAGNIDIRVADKAKVPDRPKQNPRLIDILAGVLFGTLLGLMIVLVGFVWKDTIKSETDIETRLQIRVLGSVKKQKKLKVKRKK